MFKRGKDNGHDLWKNIVDIENSVEGKVSDEISLKQFSFEIKNYSSFLEIALFTVQQILNFLG